MSRLPLIDVQAKPDPLTLDQNFRVLREKFNGAINTTDISPAAGITAGQLAGSIPATKLLGVYARGEATVSNTAAETQILSQALTGGEVSQRSLVLTFAGLYTNNTGAGQTVTIRIKIGATTLWGSVSGSLTSAAVPRGLSGQLTIPVGPTFQMVSGWIFVGSATAASVAGIGPDAAPAAQWHLTGTAAETISTNPALAFTVQHSAASTNLSLNCWALLELI